MKVECGIITCKHNAPTENPKYGICMETKGVVLRWRFAVDMGKGSMVCVECLNMEIPEKLD